MRKLVVALVAVFGLSFSLSLARAESRLYLGSISAHSTGRPCPSYICAYASLAHKFTEGDKCMKLLSAIAKLKPKKRKRRNIEKLAKSLATTKSGGWFGGSLGAKSVVNEGEMESYNSLINLLLQKPEMMSWDCEQAMKAIREVSHKQPKQLSKKPNSDDKRDEEVGGNDVPVKPTPSKKPDSNDQGDGEVGGNDVSVKPTPSKKPNSDDKRDEEVGGNDVPVIPTPSKKPDSNDQGDGEVGGNDVPVKPTPSKKPGSNDQGDGDVGLGGSSVQFRPDEDLPPSVKEQEVGPKVKLTQKPSKMGNDRVDTDDDDSQVVEVQQEKPKQEAKEVEQESKEVQQEAEQKDTIKRTKQQDDGEKDNEDTNVDEDEVEDIVKDEVCVPLSWDNTASPYCGMIDYDVRLETKDVKLPQNVYSAWDPSSERYYYYRWTKDTGYSASTFEPPGFDFALLHDKAAAIVKEILDSDKGSSCEMHVKNAVCHQLFKRCKATSKGKESAKVGYVPDPQHPALPVCNSMCNAVKDFECVKSQAPSKWKSLFADCEGEDWSGTREDCCCGHNWGMYVAGGQRSDKTGILQFTGDVAAMMIPTMRSPNSHHRRLFFSNEDRLLTDLKPEEVTVGDVSYSELKAQYDYARQDVNVDRIKQALGLVDNSSTYLNRHCEEVSRATHKCQSLAKKKKIVYKEPSSFSTTRHHCFTMNSKPFQIKDNLQCASMLRENERYRFTTFKKQHNAYPAEPPVGDFASMDPVIPDQPCSSRMLETSSEDYVLIYVTTHGGENGDVILSDDGVNQNEMTTTELKEIVWAMHDQRRYKRLLVVIDACFSGKMFRGWDLPPGAFGMSAAVGEFVAFGSFSKFEYEGVIALDTSHFTGTLLEVNKGTVNKPKNALEHVCKSLEEDLSSLEREENDDRKVSVDFTPSLLPRCFGVRLPGVHSGGVHLMDFFHRRNNVVSEAAPVDYADMKEYSKAVKKESKTKDRKRDEFVQKVRGIRKDAEKIRSIQWRNSYLSARRISVFSGQTNKEVFYPPRTNRNDASIAGFPHLAKLTFEELQKLDCDALADATSNSQPISKTLDLSETDELKLALTRFAFYVSLSRGKISPNLSDMTRAVLQEVERYFGDNSGTTLSLPKSFFSPQTLWRTLGDYLSHYKYDNASREVNFMNQRNVFMFNEVVDWAEKMIKEKCPEDVNVMSNLNLMLNNIWKIHNSVWKSMESTFGEQP